MTEPTVCAIMLTRDRPELAKRAVECFRKQTYENKTLLVFDTSEFAYSNQIVRGMKEAYARMPDFAGQTIGALRNAANTLAQADILLHFDDDDFSHPNRIAEQVALLQASGADCVGYNEMLFWRTVIGPVNDVEKLAAEDPDGFSAYVKAHDGEAWLYSFRPPKPTLGTSLCYWRKTWERKPFNPRLPNDFESTGEDSEFIQGLKVAVCSSLVYERVGLDADGQPYGQTNPRMIARIHGGNTAKYNLEESRGDTWKRVPEWDQRVRDILK